MSCQFSNWMSSSEFQCHRDVINDTKRGIGANTSRTAWVPSACLEIDELRECRKLVAISRLTCAFCDILCGCPRGARLRGL
jgi:hypothetical protein